LHRNSARQMSICHLESSLLFTFYLQNLLAAIESAVRANLVRHYRIFAVRTHGKTGPVQMIM
jgi:hypothetical protein